MLKKIRIREDAIVLSFSANVEEALDLAVQPQSALADSLPYAWLEQALEKYLRVNGIDAVKTETEFNGETDRARFVVVSGDISGIAAIEPPAPWRLMSIDPFGEIYPDELNSRT